MTDGTPTWGTPNDPPIASSATAAPRFALLVEQRCHINNSGSAWNIELPYRLEPGTTREGAQSEALNLARTFRPIYPDTGEKYREVMRVDEDNLVVIVQGQRKWEDRPYHFRVSVAEVLG